MCRVPDWMPHPRGSGPQGRRETLAAQQPGGGALVCSTGAQLLFLPAEEH